MDKVMTVMAFGIIRHCLAKSYPWDAGWVFMYCGRMIHGYWYNQGYTNHLTMRIH
jgi:hypothetical protein